MAALLAVTSVSRGARGDEPAPAAAESSATESSANVEEARRLFMAGVALVKKTAWAEALAAFERSAALRPHPVTTFNVAACQRAMGQYARARQTFSLALQMDADAGGEALSGSIAAEIRGYIAEIDGLLAKAAIRLTPADTAIAIDGRPLQRLPDGDARPRLAAGLRSPGPGEPPPSGRFEVVLEPGVHVLTLSRPGYADRVVRRTFAPGSSSSLELDLDRLPATLRISANRARAAVSVDGIDVGVAPVELTRPAGTYHVVVRKQGFIPYETRVAVRPGEQARLNAALPEERPLLLERWWFWAAAGSVVTGAILVTYAATRPDPERPPLNGGGLDWVIEVK
ncbi:hypothetical protein BE08_26645 [Sorangium cellulosum]|uniref:PEGA domain-containing protein n=1 Tax=Sorangium cellulosum TaxID=56 RepID=A0A150P0L7_SORCE|nr:hypothetical protein BE08_26645 [Sorangium cellulosum]